MPFEAPSAGTESPAGPMPEIIGRLAAVADELARSGDRDGRALAHRLRRRLRAIDDDGGRPTLFGEAGAGAD